MYTEIPNTETSSSTIFIFLSYQNNGTELTKTKVSYIFQHYMKTNKLQSKSLNSFKHDHYTTYNHTSDELTAHHVTFQNSGFIKELLILQKFETRKHRQNTVISIKGYKTAYDYS